MFHVSKYDPEICAKIIEMMADGFTITAAAGALRVHRDTVYGWAEQHPEFKQALDVARQARQYFWENRIKSTAMGPQVTAAIFALKNANPKEWSDRAQLEMSGPDGSPIQSEVTHIVREIVYPKENQISEK